MLENAREHGVAVHEGARVLECSSRGTALTGVRVKCDGTSPSEVRARVVSTPAAKAPC
jgi:hypothetical protein